MILVYALEPSRSRTERSMFLAGPSPRDLDGVPVFHSLPGTLDAAVARTQ